MNEPQPAKRIPKSIGTDAKLLGTYTLTDAAVGLIPGAVVVLATQVLIPPSFSVGGYAVQTFTLPLAVVAMTVGAVFVYLTPAYCTSAEWLTTMLSFHGSTTSHKHDEATDATQVAAIHPERGAIERTDGAFIGLVQVSPPPMALATDAEWAAKADAFQDFLNTAVTFPIQIYSTTQPFPVDEYLDRYRARLSDPDVKANPQLTALIENYVDWYEQDLAARQMTIRDHYVVVPVTPGEVRYDRDSMLARLADLPYLGVFVDVWFAPPRAQQREAMFDALDERLRRVEGGIRDIDGCEASVVDAAEAAHVIAEFWAGDELAYGDVDQTVRTSPFVGEVP